MHDKHGHPIAIGDRVVTDDGTAITVHGITTNAEASRLGITRVFLTSTLELVGGQGAAGHPREAEGDTVVWGN